MKIYNKIVVKSVFLIGLVFFMLLSVTNCKKNEHPTNNELLEKTEIKKQNLSVIDNRLVFETRIDYENTINYLSKKGDDYFPIWEKEIGFNSVRKITEEAENNEVEFDALFATLLNPDYIIQIGNKVFKIDMKNETVFILDESEYLGSESFSTRMAISYSINDNILDIIDGIEQPDIDRGGCPSAKKGYYNWSVYGGQAQYKIAYQKAGIYFSLQAKIKKDFYGGSAYISLSVQPNCWYQPKRRRSTNIAQSSKGGYGHEYNIRPYQSTRRLDGYYYKVYYYASDTGHGYGPYSATLIISC